MSKRSIAFKTLSFIALNCVSVNLLAAEHEKAAVENQAGDRAVLACPKIFGIPIGKSFLSRVDAINDVNALKALDSFTNVQSRFPKSVLQYDSGKILPYPDRDFTIRSAKFSEADTEKMIKFITNKYKDAQVSENPGYSPISSEFSANNVVPCFDYEGFGCDGKSKLDLENAARQLIKATQEQASLEKAKDFLEKAQAIVKAKTEAAREKAAEIEKTYELGDLPLDPEKDPGNKRIHQRATDFARDYGFTMVTSFLPADYVNGDDPGSYQKLEAAKKTELKKVLDRASAKFSDKRDLYQEYETALKESMNPNRDFNLENRKSFPNEMSFYSDFAFGKFKAIKENTDCTRGNESSEPVTKKLVCAQKKVAYYSQALNQYLGKASTNRNIVNALQGASPKDIVAIFKGSQGCLAPPFEDIKTYAAFENMSKAAEEKSAQQDKAKQAAKEADSKMLAAGRNRYSPPPEIPKTRQAFQSGNTYFYKDESGQFHRLIQGLDWPNQSGSSIYYYESSNQGIRYRLGNDGQLRLVENNEASSNH